MPMFNPFRRIHRTKNAYKRVFAGADADLVLQDLARFGGLYDPVFVPGRSQEEVLIRLGRREMLLRVLRFVKLSEREANDLYQKMIELETEGEQQ